MSPIAGIPPESRALFERLLTEPPAPVDQLRSECRAYLARFEGLARQDGLLDPQDARTIAAICEGLLDHLGPTPEPQAHALVHAATRYFVLEEDGDDDDCIGGLEDDLSVARAVARALGRGDLAER